MKRLKHLWLAAAAVIAVAAFPAGASAAGGIESETQQTWVEGYNVDGHIWAFGELSVGCSEVLFDAAEMDEPRAAALTAPTWIADCSQSVKYGDCEFTFHPGTESSVDIGPPGCEPMSIQFGSVCLVEIGAQTGLPATYTNLGEWSEGTVRADIGTNELVYTSEGPFCKDGTSEDGQYFGEVELRGFADAAMTEQVGIKASDGETGLYVSGSELEAEVYPVQIFGEQDPAEEFEFVPGGGEESPVVCEEAQFDAAVSEAVTELAVEAGYGECEEGNGFPVTFEMNSCHYVYGIANGDVELACDEEGDAVELTVHVPFFADCFLDLTPKSAGEASYANHGEGPGRTVGASMAGTRVDYTVEGNKLCEEEWGAEGEGELSGGATLAAAW